MATVAVRKWYERPQALPFDFIGTKHHVERLAVLQKKEGVSIIEPAGSYGGSVGTVATFPAYFVFVMTPYGDMRLRVSKNVFELVREGEDLIVSYRVGRWSGALKGKIAR